MRFLRFLPIALLAGLLSPHGAASARAATVTPFTEQAFKSAQADGQPVLVDMSATCARMRSTLIVFHGATLKGASVGDTDPRSDRTLETVLVEAPAQCS